MAYLGHDISSSEESDVEGCRSSCKRKGADYFTFIVGNNLCECKDSAVGRREQVGRISGEASCTGEKSSPNNHWKDRCQIAQLYSAMLFRWLRGAARCGPLRRGRDAVVRRRAAGPSARVHGAPAPVRRRRKGLRPLRGSARWLDTYVRMEAHGPKNILIKV